ncbi:MAG TPA: crosslink repair DNA glycosylase YcaQ family protein [Candidatus Bathyarchaeia archaeon]|nr:crosslink repair DNA glycosylase YcaQ family protein [Candidatus Bathyarchaeia archaeon]
MIQLSREQAQRFILHKQGLLTNNQLNSSLDVVKRIHNIQIDTISVVSRSHNLILFNRFNGYIEKTIWDLLEQKEVFEFWSHAMCFLPIEEYPYYLWKAKLFSEGIGSWWAGWAEKSKHIIEEVYEYVKKNGPTTSSDFKNTSKKPGGWWNWKDEKAALDILYSLGKLMISYRKNFQRYYDLTERVLPARISNEPLPKDELPNYLLKIVLSSIGIVNYDELKTYTGNAIAKFIWKNNKKNAIEFLDQNVEDGLLETVAIDGINENFYMLASECKEISKIDNFTNDYIAFISPFDNLIRERYLPEKFWNFEYKIECYVPEPKRKYGYYVLPILDNSQFIGRTDVKVHRKEQKLELKSIYFESNIHIDDDILERFYKGLQKFANFHECKEIVIGNVYPKDYENQIKSLII